MIETGSTAPDFELPGVISADSQETIRYHLSEKVASKPLLLNFYLFDFNPACTENMCDLHDLAWFDLDAEIEVVGISSDSVFSHRVFAEQEGLEYTLLSDSDGSVAESYGVLYDEFKGHKRLPRRSVFLLDTSRTVRYSWCAEYPDEQPDWEQVKAAIDDLRAD